VMENTELLTKIARTKKRLCKMMEELEQQSDIRFGFTDKVPEVYVHHGIGDISRCTDQFMVADKSGMEEYPILFRTELEGVAFIELTGDRYAKMQL